MNTCPTDSNKAMKKTFCYNFIPSKAEEEAAAARSVPHQVTRSLVEIRDLYPPPPVDPTNPWAIRRTLSANEVVAGKILLTHYEMFEHVLRYWSMGLSNDMLLGNRQFVAVVDCTDSEDPRMFGRSEWLYVERGPNDCYVVGLTDVVRVRSCRCGDEIGLFWDTKVNAFNFKVLGRALQ